MYLVTDNWIAIIINYTQCTLLCFVAIKYSHCSCNVGIPVSFLAVIDQYHDQKKLKNTNGLFSLRFHDIAHH